jgi:hypothetical protein
MLGQGHDKCKYEHKLVAMASLLAQLFSYKEQRGLDNRRGARARAVCPQTIIGGKDKFKICCSIKGLNIFILNILFK